MKVLLSWLREFAPFPDDDPVALGDIMSDLGMAVESIDRIGEGLDGIVVAQVLAVRAHPDADRIQLVDVDRGDGDALQICCGAFNMAVGDRVPLATLGTVMPGGMEIARRKMRGEWSNGMLCSGRELGLGDDHDGILILDTEAQPGTPIADALGITPDVLFDLEINPNRPDAMSVAGVARDLAARLGLPFTIPTPVVDETAGDATTRISVVIDAPDLCGRFHVRILENVTVGPSPRWVADRLTACGMRPINNVVDASNYVMLELGQPSHAFDLAKVPTGGFRIRWSTEGERITTLDGVERALTAGRDGVICDISDTPIAIAGVMGGASTEISSATSAVLLECAWWQPMAVARSSKFLGLRSEASARFERGTDPEIVDLAARRFAEILAPSGARLVTGAVTAEGDLPARAPVTVRVDRVDALLGTTFAVEEIVGILTSIGFTVGSTADPRTFEVSVPSFRPDTVTETDVIEEIARHHGYSAIPDRLPSSPQTGSLSARQRDRRTIRAVLVGMGLHEAMPLPFLAPDDLQRCGLPPESVVLTNPLAAEESVLRTSLRPGLLRAIAYNESHRTDGAALFELGKVFGRPSPGDTLPDEREHLGAAMAGVDVRRVVELWFTLHRALGLGETEIDQERECVGLHPGRRGVIVVDGVDVGVLGEIDPSVGEAMALQERVAWLELDLDRLLGLTHGDHRYRPISRYPSSDLDLAFELDEQVPAARLGKVIRTAADPLLVDLHLFDVFRGGPVAEGRRSLAWRLRLQARDRTLTETDIAEVVDRVTAAADGLGAILRR